MGIGWLSASVIIGAGGVYLAAVSQLPRAAPPIDQICRTQVVKPASVQLPHATVGPSSTRPSPFGKSGTSFRFGFLEFEDDPDASAE